MAPSNISDYFVELTTVPELHTIACFLFSLAFLHALFVFGCFLITLIIATACSCPGALFAMSCLVSIGNEDGIWGGKTGKKGLITYSMMNDDGANGLACADVAPCEAPGGPFVATVNPETCSTLGLLRTMGREGEMGWWCSGSAPTASKPQAASRNPSHQSN
jgi:hypothetical protein